MTSFTHVYCDKCDDIQPAKRNGDIECGICGYTIVKLDERQQGYCEVCDKFQPLKHEEPHGENVSGQFVGEDILCVECRYVIATVFIPIGDTSATIPS